MNNLDHLGILNIIRCLILQFASDGIQVISFRAKDGKGVIEVVNDSRLLATGERNGFSFYVEQGISIIWSAQGPQASAS